MNRVIYVFAAFVLLISSGCNKNKFPDSTSVTSELRILNATPMTFYNCIIDPSGTLSNNPGPEAYNFGEVNINGKTEYKSFAMLYRYSWVRLTMNNKMYYIRPYDYTGETTLPSGRYTYKLSYNSTVDQLNIELIKD